MASTGEEFGLFWNSVSGDRTYDSDSFSKWLKKFFTTGVFNGDFQVVASSGMQINVKGGYANIAGKVYFMDNDKTLTLAVANSTYPRIDTIVITCDYINRKIFVENITGQLSGNSPVATAPVRNTEKYQIVLAQIRVNAGVTSITQTQITDTRTNNNLCGYIAGTVTQMNFAQFTAQFESYFTQFKNNNLESFNTWFNGIKEQLTDDVAGNLQSQIDSTNSDLTSKYNELKNASNINYSNTSSELTATKVQGAIDEVVTKVNTANSNISAANNNISGLTTRVGALENGLSTTNSNVSTANSNINSLKTRATNLETRATNLETKATNLENELTANNKRIYMDYHDGKYGINTSANRGADSFVPFKSTIECEFSVTSHSNYSCSTDFQVPIGGVPRKFTMHAYVNASSGDWQSSGQIIIIKNGETVFTSAQVSNDRYSTTEKEIPNIPTYNLTKDDTLTVRAWATGDQENVNGNGVMRYGTVRCNITLE